MDQTVPAASANRTFSRLLRAVREGQSYLVTSHGKPVARIIPVDERTATAAGARATLLARLKRQRTVKAGRWTRDELYEAER
ncbi:MAG: type II toxin-antitoxin system prevent-host-death family antitoxin [Bauldia sp.]